MGAKNKYAAKLEKLLEAHQTVEGETPLQFLVTVYQNRNNKLDLRVEAAKAAAVYVHRKMPVAIEHSGEVAMPMSVTIVTPMTRLTHDAGNLTG